MRKTAILLALACALARADYGPGTTDSDLLRSGTPVVTNAWLAVSNETVRIARSVAGDAGAITDGTNRIDATRDVWRIFSGRVCTNASEVWTYSVGGATYTAEQMADAVGGGDSGYSQILVWQNAEFYGKDGAEEYEGWFVVDGSGTAPLGYSYITGDIPESSANHFLALAEYIGFDYAGGTNVSITAFRGTFESGTNYVGRLALTNDIPAAPDFTTGNAQLVQTIRSTAPAPGNYLAVSNAAMNARGMTDLAVRGSPQGDGSYFLVNGEIAIWIGGHEYPEDDGWYGDVHISPLAGGYYWLNTGGGATTNFMLQGEDYTATLNLGGETYHVQGFLGTLALNSDVPKGAVTTNEHGVVEANLGIYGSLAQGTNTTASGAYSHAEGDRTLASGKAAHAEGVATRAQGEASHVSGVNVYATQRATFGAGVSVNGTNSASFIWSGQETSPWYGTHGKGSFNVDPIGGIAGMWIGNDALLSILYASLSSDEPHTATIEFDETAGTSVTTNFPPLREAVVGTIREHSLGGIWDSRLGVWWRPVMENGALRYVAATNVNLSAEGN